MAEHVIPTLFGGFGGFLSLDKSHSDSPFSQVYGGGTSEAFITFKLKNSSGKYLILSDVHLRNQWVRCVRATGIPLQFVLALHGREYLLHYDAEKRAPIAKIKLEVGSLEYTIPVCLKFIGKRKPSEDPLLVYKDDSGIYFINLRQSRSCKIMSEFPAPDQGFPESVNVYLDEKCLKIVSTTHKTYEFQKGN